MSEVAQGTQQEFWRPPTHPLQPEALPRELPVMAETCPRCGSEFLLGSRYCHSCGGHRPRAISTSARADAAAVAGWWERCVHWTQSLVSGISKIKFPAWMKYLHFHEIKDRIGLSTGSLIAFVAGMACIAGALLVGLLTAKTLVDWQAIQYYRAEWLLGATASFVLGILLKGNPRDRRD